jgi:hypothetical protein
LLNAIAFLIFAILLTILRRRSNVEIRPELGRVANETSRFARRQTQRHRRLAPVADLMCSAMVWP